MNSQRNKSRDSTGSHGVPAGEADNNNFWDLQTKTSRKSLRKAKINTVQEKETKGTPRVKHKGGKEKETYWLTLRVSHCLTMVTR